MTCSPGIGCRHSPQRPETRVRNGRWTGPALNPWPDCVALPVSRYYIADYLAVSVGNGEPLAYRLETARRHPFFGNANPEDRRSRGAGGKDEGIGLMHGPSGTLSSTGMNDRASA